MNDEKNCKDCAFCNVQQYNRGRWYCSSPEVSVFVPVPYEKPCFKPRKDHNDRKDEA